MTVSEDLEKLRIKANGFAVDAVDVRDELIKIEGQVVLLEAHRDRLWKAMGEIEEYVKESDKVLEEAFSSKQWVPYADRVDSDTAHPIPVYFDALAHCTAKLRPIILGAK